LATQLPPVVVIPPLPPPPAMKPTTLIAMDLPFSNKSDRFLKSISEPRNVNFYTDEFGFRNKPRKIKDSKIIYKDKSYNTFVLESFFCEKGIISLIDNR
jgi:hypothetical protein